MGVPRLFKWLVENFPEAVKYFQYGEYRQTVDYLYLDSNGLLHSEAQRVFNYGEFKRRLNSYASLSYEAKTQAVYSSYFERIMDLIKVITPTKVLYIAIDGPAPLAKQSQQRERRFVSARERASSSEDTSEQFDSNAITPGTNFMHGLTQYLNYAIRKEMTKNKLLKGVEVHFSPVTVAGEGEHKLLDFIRSLDEEERNKASHCLFGPDGDLIMLTLSSHIPNMFLFREDQYTPGFLHFIDMGNVRKRLPQTLGQIQGYKQKKRSLDDVTNDFVLEGFFVGNDFLPKIQMFHLLEEGLQFMLTTYRLTSSNGIKNYLTVDGKLNIPGFTVFVEELSKYEIKHITKQYHFHPPEPKFKNNTLLKHIAELTISDSSKSNQQERHKLKLTLDFDGYRKDYYLKFLHPIDATTKEGELQIRQVCIDYIKTLEWVLEYYVDGLPDWRWAYPRHYAPLMKDLHHVLATITDSEIAEIYKFKRHHASLPFVQLLSVLPSVSSDLLPKQFRRLMTKKSSPLVKAGYYPDLNSFKIDYEGKTQGFLGIALLPHVDYNVIYKAYKKMAKCCTSHHPKGWNKNKIGKNMIFKYTEGYSAIYSSPFGKIPIRVKRTYYDN